MNKVEIKGVKQRSGRKNAVAENPRKPNLSNTHIYVKLPRNK